MGRSSKRLFGWILIALFGLSVILIAVGNAEGDTTTDGFIYSLIEGGSEVEITGYVGSSTEVVIPDQIDGQPVTTIGSGAFAYTNVVSVIMPGSVLNINDSAFAYCEKLTSIEIGPNVTTIGPGAFSFSNRLHSVNIPASVETIGEFAFYPAGGLVTIDVDPSNQYYQSIDGILYDKDQMHLIQCPNGRVESVQISGGVLYVDNYSFSNCLYLTSVSMTSGVTTIGSYAFSSCAELVRITLSDTVTSIGEGAFQHSDVASIYFDGFNAPTCGDLWLEGTNPTLYYYQGATGFTTPMWEGHDCVELTGASAPLNLFVELAGSDVELSWTGPVHYSPEVLSFNVYRGVNQYGTELIGSVPSTTTITNYVDNEVLEVGATYFYQVSAVDANGEGSKSDMVSFTIPVPEMFAVTGKVVDSDGTGLAGIEVALENESSVTTGTQGNFSINASAGQHTLTFSGDEIESKDLDIMVEGPGLDVGNVTTAEAKNSSENGLDIIWIVVIVAAVAVVAVLGVLMWQRSKRKK
jgi:hypothetical protein